MYHVLEYGGKKTVHFSPHSVLYVSQDDINKQQLFSKGYNRLVFTVDPDSVHCDLVNELLYIRTCYVQFLLLLVKVQPYLC